MAAKTWHPFPERLSDLNYGIGICPRCGTANWLILRSKLHGFYESRNSKQIVNCKPNHDTA